MMVPEEALCLLPQFVADGLHHRHLSHQLGKGPGELRFHKGLVGQVFVGAPSALAQKLDVKIAVLQAV